MSYYANAIKDISAIPDFIQFYTDELSAAKYDVSIRGNVEKNISTLPGITEQRFNQLQEIEAVLRHMELQLRKIRRKHFQKYLETYARALTSRDAEKYVDGEDEVVDYESIINEVSLIREQWNVDISDWRKKMIASPRFFSFNLPKLLAPKIPSGIKQKLDEKFYQSMLNFTNEIFDKIK